MHDNDATGQTLAGGRSFPEMGMAHDRDVPLEKEINHSLVQQSWGVIEVGDASCRQRGRLLRKDRATG
jgi:hypothetical protein